MTELTMTEGEKLHAERRKKYWRNLTIVGAFGAPLGFGVGFGFGKSRGDFDAFWTMVPQWLSVSLILVAAVGLIYGSWLFYKSIDEIELADNLWSSFAAYGAYALIFPAWWALNKAGAAPEPNDWLIYLAALLIGLAAYGKRKWDAR